MSAIQDAELALEPYPWPQGRSGAFAVTVDVDGPIPHLWRTRDTGTRFSELEQRSYGPRRGIWRLLEIFDAAATRATFYVPGAYAERHPDVVREIVGRGHELGLHGWLHEPPVDLTRQQFYDVTARSLQLLRAYAGDEGIVGFRSPSWDMTDDAFDVLIELGLRYDSSVMGDDRPYRLRGITEIPVSWNLDDAPFYRYVGGGAPGHPPHRVGDVIERWREEADAARRFGTLAVLTVHDWLTGRPAPAAALADLLVELGKSELWMPTVAELVHWHEREVTSS